jgi:hypothetical protein
MIAGTYGWQLVCEGYVVVICEVDKRIINIAAEHVYLLLLCRFV